MMPTGYNPYMGAPSSMFYQTGIAGLNGGYAYPPGSSMGLFMDQLNTTTSRASMLGKGMGMMPQMGSPPQQGGNSSGMMVPMMGTLLGMILHKAAPLLKERLANRQQPPTRNQ